MIRIGACATCGENMACCHCRETEEFVPLLEALIEMGYLKDMETFFKALEDQDRETEYHLHPFGY